MSRSYWYAIAVAIASLAGTSQLHAQAEWGCDVEALFLKVGTNVGTRAANAANFDPGLRFAFSRIAEDGLGVRITYFEYDHTIVDPGLRSLTFDTYNVDFEILQELSLTDRVNVEMSAGLRYNDTQFSFPSRFEPSDFSGVGGIVGIRGSAKIFENGEFYARTKFALMIGDGGHDSNASPLPKAYNTGRGMTEIAFGYQHTFEVGRYQIVPRIGAEWQMWHGIIPDIVDEHPETNLLLGGFTTGLGINF